MFGIKSIDIYPECRYRKNLETGIYPLEETPLEDFFGENDIGFVSAKQI